MWHFFPKIKYFNKKKYLRGFYKNKININNEFLIKKAFKENIKIKKDSNERKYSFEIGENKANIIRKENYKSFRKEIAKISNSCDISNF